MDPANSATVFPDGLPPELAAAACVAGREVAWTPSVVLAAVEWLGKHRYAVLGTELWVVQGGSIKSLPKGTSGKPDVHGNTVNRERGETWDSFVARAARDTLAYLRSFRPEEILETGELYFNVVYVSEAEFDRL